jgi:uncharacterized protein YjbJ (UPF0337 family)
MAKDRDHEVAKQEKAEFRKKGGAAVGDKDSAVDGHLSEAAGASQESRGGDKHEVRPRLEETAKALEESAGKPKR